MHQYILFLLVLSAFSTFLFANPLLHQINPSSLPPSDTLNTDVSVLVPPTYSTVLQKYNNTYIGADITSRGQIIRHQSTQECDFDSIEEFFDYAYKEKLNITAEVVSCQNLCVMTYGKGNPDLSGIGVSAWIFRSKLIMLIFPR